MRRTRSFTLIELLAVIAIISILAGIALGIAKYAAGKGRQTKTLAQMRALESGLDNCKSDRGYYPSTVGASTDFVQLGDHFDASYAKLSTLGANWPLSKSKFRDEQTARTYLEGYDGGDYLDAWGRPFLYRCDGNQRNVKTFDLFSAGPDGTPGTDDDITNWQRN